MRKINWKWFVLFLGLIVLIITVFLPRQTTAQQDCLTQPSIEIATVKAKGNTYRLYRPKTLDPHGAIETLIMENSNGLCVRLNDEPDGIIRPLSSYTDLSIALALNKQKWKQIIQSQGGVEKFQQGLNQYAAKEDKHYMPSDAYEALSGLKIQIPDNVHPYDEPPGDIPTIKHESND